MAVHPAALRALLRRGVWSDSLGLVADAPAADRRLVYRVLCGVPGFGVRVDELIAPVWDRFGDGEAAALLPGGRYGDRPVVAAGAGPSRG